MGASINSAFGLAFLVLAVFLTFLMFYLWKFPFDHKTQKSAAPRGLTYLHRGMGYVFVGIYIFLMWDMVPRLWTYQVELPARTVVHLTLGFAVGAILFLKIFVVRFFKHLESTLAPLLGSMLLICTLLLTGLALPYSAREAYLRSTAQDSEGFSQDRIDRVTQFLPQLGFDDLQGLRHLASYDGLSEGRTVLNGKCTQCHDLRTILVKPRTPEGWKSTVDRMATRASALNPITDSEKWAVTAYLIAITPALQKTAASKRKATIEAQTTAQLARNAAEARPVPLALQEAQVLFESKCSQCHSPQLVENSDLDSRAKVVSLVSRMVGNGLRAEEAELGQIMLYLADRYVPG